MSQDIKEHEPKQRRAKVSSAACSTGSIHLPAMPILDRLRNPYSTSVIFRGSFSAVTGCPS